jgi:hypothetical protein
VGSGLLDLTSDNLGDELGGKLGQAAAGGLTLDDVGHAAADGADLGRLSVGGLADLVRSALSESDGEETDEVVIGGLDGDVGLNESLPLADKGSELVGGEVETVEVGQAVLALNLIDSELDLAEGVLLILLEVGEGNLEDTSLKSVVGVLKTGGAVDEGLSDTEPIPSVPIRFLLSQFPPNVEKSINRGSWGVLTRAWRRWKEPVDRPYQRRIPRKAENRNFADF